MLLTTSVVPKSMRTLSEFTSNSLAGRPRHSSSLAFANPRRESCAIARRVAKGCGEVGEGVEVGPILLALTLIGTASLGANQRLRRAFPLGDVRHIEFVLLDRLMEMLAAILADSEPADLCLCITGEGL